MHVQTGEATAVEVEQPKDETPGQESGEAAGSREAADPASQPADSSASAPYLQPAEQVGPPHMHNAVEVDCESQNGTLLQLAAPELVRGWAC